VTSIQLGDSAGRGWLNVRPEQVTARGTVRPRLFITLYAGTTREKRFVDIHLLRGTLIFENEQLGEGFITGLKLNYVDRPLTLEVPISREALQYVTDRATGERIDFILELSGWMEVFRELTADDPAYAGESPAPGERGFIPVGGGGHGQVRMQIARSDWFTQVMEPVGTLSYVVTEIPLPKGAATTVFQPVLGHLREAERSYATGSDAAVFFHCRAALEALHPGSPKDTFSQLPDPDLAECMNALMKESVDYLHRGRHTQKEGEQRGEFPVDHADALFALAMTRLLIAQSSRLLSGGTA
jgi:hypothetical protein